MKINSEKIFLYPHKYSLLSFEKISAFFFNFLFEFNKKIYIYMFAYIALISGKKL